jgi:hypothetical protein
VESWGVCLLELLPEVRCPAYRFEAQVRQDASEDGFVGLFFLADERPVPGGMEQRYAAFLFADQGDHQGTVRVNLNRFREPGPFLGQQDSRLRIPFRPPPTGAAGTWHTLAVTVGPAGFRAGWDGREVLAAPRARWRPWARSWWAGLHKAQPPALPPFAGRGALGLYLERSRAEFRNVTIRPL